MINIIHGKLNENEVTVLKSVLDFTNYSYYSFFDISKDEYPQPKEGLVHEKTILVYDVKND